jgi:hypothetical protein
MKIPIAFSLLALPVLITSCATPQPPQAFHNTDNNALIVASLDSQTCQVIQPTPTDKEPNDALLNQVRQLPQHQTAVVILENYSETQPGHEFRDRGVDLFVGLRGAGYQHIVFLHGNGGVNPDGLLTVANYD